MAMDTKDTSSINVQCFPPLPVDNLGLIPWQAWWCEDGNGNNELELTTHNLTDYDGSDTLMLSLVSLKMGMLTLQWFEVSHLTI